MGMNTVSPGDRIHLDIQLIELRASRNFSTAQALGIATSIITPLYGAIFVLAGVEKPTRNMRSAASKIAEELQGWANPKL